MGTDAAQPLASHLVLQPVKMKMAVHHSQGGLRCLPRAAFRCSEAQALGDRASRHLGDLVSSYRWTGLGSGVVVWVAGWDDCCSSECPPSGKQARANS